MKHALTTTTAAALSLGLAFAFTALAADDDPPSFRKSKDRTGKEFAAAVFETIIKGVRSVPLDVKFEKHKYTTTQKGRTDLELVGTYKGKISRQTFTATITLRIDTTDSTVWEVLSIDYKDNNRITGRPKQKSIDQMILRLNR